MRSIEETIVSLNTAALAKRLVAIPSYSFMPDEEKNIASYIAELMRREGISVRLDEVEPGRPNVIATLPGRGEGSLMLMGHMDTVPAYDMERAFEPRIEHGILYGRGACDMKGALAAMITAMIAIKRAGTELPGELIFAGVVDEEEGGRGAEYVSDFGPFADAAIIGEPTELAIALGHKGLEWIEVSFEGRKVHGGDQKNGVNAIEMAARFIEKVYGEYAPRLARRTHPVLGEASINIGRIEGGDQPSTVAGECRILLDRRSVPGETREQVYRELQELCDSLHIEDERFLATVRDLMKQKTGKPHYPYCVSKDERIAQSLGAAVASVGREPVYTSFHAWSDAGTLARYTDCIPLVCGPGKLANAHSVSDSVPTAELDEAALIYARAALDYFGIRNEK